MILVTAQYYCFPISDILNLDCDNPRLITWIWILSDQYFLTWTANLKNKKESVSLLSGYISYKKIDWTSRLSKFIVVCMDNYIYVLVQIISEEMFDLGIVNIIRLC